MHLGFPWKLKNRVIIQCKSVASIPQISNQQPSEFKSLSFSAILSAPKIITDTWNFYPNPMKSGGAKNHKIAHFGKWKIQMCGLLNMSDIYKCGQPGICKKFVLSHLSSSPHLWLFLYNVCFYICLKVIWMSFMKKDISKNYFQYILYILWDLWIRNENYTQSVTCVKCGAHLKTGSQSFDCQS